MNGNDVKGNALDRAVDAVRSDEPRTAEIEAGARRIWERLALETGADAGSGEPVTAGRIRDCADFQALIPIWLDGMLPSSRATLVADHTRHCVPCRRALLAARALRESGGAAPAAAAPRPRPRWLAPALRAAAAVVLVGGVSAAAVMVWRQVGPPVVAASGQVQSIDGELYRIADASILPLEAGATIGRGEVVRTGRGSGAVVRLPEGSRIELRERSEMVLARKGDGAVIELARGSVMVEASPQGSGHLYVRTADCLVSVTGTIFSVDHGAFGSRVGVVEGEVHVAQGRRTTVLEPGDQVATNPEMAPVALAEQIAWSREAGRYLSMLASVRALGREIDQRVGMPAMRTSTRLLDLAPAGTVVYAAFPNLSAQIGEAHRLLQERMAGDEVLRAWWERTLGAPALEGEVRNLVTRIEALGAHIGDEIAVAVQGDDEGRPATFVLLAELRDAEAFRDGLAAELERAAPEAGRNGWRFLDRGADPTSAGENGGSLLLWAHDGLFVASPSGRAVSRVLAASRGGAPGGSSAFRERIADAYADGADWLFCVDAARLLPHEDAAPGVEDLERMGVLDVQHVLVEHERHGDKGMTRAVLTFDGPRRGLASWLAEPAPMGALGFVSPDAMMAAAFVVKEPARLADDLVAFAGDGSLAEAMERFRREHGVDLRRDLAEPLGGELVFAVDGPVLPKPAWKLAIEVYDPAHLQQTLSRLVAEADRTAREEGHEGVSLTEERAGGRTYHVLHTPALDVHYTFVDGYLLAAPARVLLDQAIERRRAGLGLTTSARFAALMPEGTGTHVSALAWENLGPALSAAQAVTGGNAKTADLAKDWPGTLVYAVAESDRITFSSSGKAGLEDDITRLFGLPGLLQGRDQVERELSEAAKPQPSGKR